MGQNGSHTSCERTSQQACLAWRTAVVDTHGVATPTLEEL